MRVEMRLRENFEERRLSHLRQADDARSHAVGSLLGEGARSEERGTRRNSGLRYYSSRALLAFACENNVKQCQLSRPGCRNRPLHESRELRGWASALAH
jgi:hypothetical protein